MGDKFLSPIPYWRLIDMALISAPTPRFRPKSTGFISSSFLLFPILTLCELSPSVIFP